MHSISPGSFVSDVFAGSGPVVVLREGAVINQSFIETVERYSIPYLPVRYFDKRLEVISKKMFLHFKVGILEMLFLRTRIFDGE